VGTSILKIQLKIMSEEERGSNHPSPPFQEKEKECEGTSKAWWPMEGSKLGGQWEKNSFHFFSLSPQPNLLKPSIFPFDLKILLYHGFRPLLTRFLPFFDL
jgi:hypothetical protein